MPTSTPPRGRLRGRLRPAAGGRALSSRPLFVLEEPECVLEEQGGRHRIHVTLSAARGALHLPDRLQGGGYPKPANAISADFWRLGQLRPRDRVRSWPRRQK